GVDTAPEPEDVVEERLQNLRRGEVGDEGVIVEAAAHRFALGDLELFETGQGLGDVVAVLLQHLVHPIQPLQRRGQLCLGVVDQSGQLLRHRGRVREQRNDRVSLRGKNCQQVVGVQYQRVDLLTAFR